MTDLNRSPARLAAGGPAVTPSPVRPAAVPSAGGPVSPCRGSRRLALLTYRARCGFYSAYPHLHACAEATVETLTALGRAPRHPAPAVESSGRLASGSDNSAAKRGSGRADGTGGGLIIVHSQGRDPAAARRRGSGLPRRYFLPHLRASSAGTMVATAALVADLGWACGDFMCSLTVSSPRRRHAGAARAGRHRPPGWIYMPEDGHRAASRAPLRLLDSGKAGEDERRRPRRAGATVS